jgi:hypothetical protein
MAKFTRLMLDDASNTWLDVNLDQVTHIQPEERYTTIHFAGGTKIDVKEKASEILNKKVHATSAE